MTSISAWRVAALALLLAAPAFAAEPPAPWVRKIELHGASQIGRARLLGKLDLKTWRDLPPDAASTVPRQVVEAYTAAGLPAPEATVSVGEPDAEGATRVRIDVVETPLPKLASFSTDLGDLPWLTSLSTRTRILIVKVGAKVARFHRKRLDDALRKEQRRLRELGWKGAGFQVQEEAAADGVALKVSLVLGPREQLKGKGIDSSVMKEVTDSWKRRNVPLSEGVVNRLARAAEAGMTERGYTEVEVVPTEKAGKDERTIVLTATHGPRLVVQELRFEGTTLPEKGLTEAVGLHAPRLLGLDKSHPGPLALEESRAALAAFYARSGFPDAKVEARMEGAGARRTLVFRVAEGPRRTIGTLTFPGATLIKEPELRSLAKLAPGKPYWPEGAATAAEAIRKELARRGHDDATVTPKAGPPDASGRVALAFEIVEGPTWRLAGTSVRGNHKTSARKILSVGDERPGKPVSSVQLAEHQSRLSRLGVFDTVSVTSTPVPGSSPPEKTVRVDVVERSTRWVEYGFDINTDRGLELAATLGERDLFRNATSGSVSALVGKKRQSFVVELGQPALLGTQLYGALKGSYIYDATYNGFALQTVGIELPLSWEFRPKHFATLSYKAELQKPVDVAQDVEESLAPETERIDSLTPGVSLDRRDDPFLTTTGTLSSLRDKISRHFLGGDNDFDRVELDLRKFRLLGNGFVLAGAVRAGYARAHDGDLPVGERFYVGGATTHRGFAERDLGPHGEDGSALGGETYLLLNAEARFPLAGLLEGGVFLDVGNAWLGGIALNDLRYAAGVGLRFRTPVGPLRLDGAYLIDAREGESRARVHIALGHAF